MFVVFFKQINLRRLFNAETILVEEVIQFNSIIIILESRWRHGVPWLSLLLTIHPNYPSLLVGLLDCVQYPHNPQLELNKRVYTFPKCINQKTNLIVRLEFELVYYDSAVQYVSHYATETPLYLFIYIYIYNIGVAVRVFANGPGHLGSIPGRVIPKTQKMVLDASLLNTQHYKVRIKGKVEQSRERSSTLPYTWV